VGGVAHILDFDFLVLSFERSLSFVDFLAFPSISLEESVFFVLFLGFPEDFPLRFGFFSPVAVELSSSLSSRVSSRVSASSEASISSWLGPRALTGADRGSSGRYLRNGQKQGKTGKRS
jgi:hypothetical protein